MNLCLLVQWQGHIYAPVCGRDISIYSTLRVYGEDKFNIYAPLYNIGRHIVMYLCMIQV